MEIQFLTIMSLAISYLTIYAINYFIYVYFFRKNERESTLFHPDISIIIPAYNEEKNLKRAIESLINQDYKGDIEIILMDDGSTDDTSKIAKSYPVVKYFKASKTGEPQGKTKAVNNGLKKASHGIVGVLDADSYLDNKAVRNLVGEFENPRVGAAVPIQRVHKPRSFIELMQMIEYTLSMCIRKLTSNADSLFITHGVGTLFRRSALEKVGYFKENTLTEDLNIGLKLVKKGYLIKSNFKSIGYTVVPGTAKNVIKQRLRWNSGLYENTYWFKKMLFNKRYGNVGLFIMPVNLAWTLITAYISLNWAKEFIKGLYYDLRNLVITGFDWGYFITNKINDLSVISINELTILGGVSLVMFLSFYLVLSRKLRLSFKESLISYLLLPFYFTIFLFINAVAVVLTPFYLLKKGGKPWLTDKTT